MASLELDRPLERPAELVRPLERPAELVWPSERPAELVRRKDLHTRMYKEILHNINTKGNDLYFLYMKNYEDQYDWWEIATYMWTVDHTYESLAARFNIDIEIVRHMMS